MEHNTNNNHTISILVIGRNKEILDKVVELITKNTTYKAQGALTDEEAIIQFRAGQFDIVLLCGGIEPESDKKLRTLFLKSNPKIKIIQHFGGGSGLLYNEIQSALKN